LLYPKAVHLKKKMKTNLLVTFFLSIGFFNLSAQFSSGHYISKMEDQEFILELKVLGNKITGEMNHNGEVAKLVSTVLNNKASGTITDNQNSFTCTFISKGNGIEFTLNVISEQGDLIPVQMEFEKLTQAKKNNLSNLNPSFVGLWRNTKTMTSGSYGSSLSLVTDHFLHLKRDGKAESWSKSAGGGDMGAYSSEPGEKEIFEWRNEGESVLIFKISSNSLENKVRVTFYEGNLVIYDSNNKPVIWEKVN
jgi:hypothetical protein